MVSARDAEPHERRLGAGEDLEDAVDSPRVDCGPAGVAVVDAKRVVRDVEVTPKGAVVRQARAGEVIRPLRGKENPVSSRVGIRGENRLAQGAIGLRTAVGRVVAVFRRGEEVGRSRRRGRQGGDPQRQGERDLQPALYGPNLTGVRGRDHPGIQLLPISKGASMNFGLRALLLLVAVILFVFAAISDSNYNDLFAWGLACLAGALLIGETGFARLGKR
jgi:hypothetical protein